MADALKGFGRERPWLEVIFWYLLGGAGDNLSQYSWCPGRDSNLPLDYESTALLLRQPISYTQLQYHEVHQHPNMGDQSVKFSTFSKHKN
jgi:hypothetical protein